MNKILMALMLTASVSAMAAAPKVDVVNDDKLDGKTFNFSISDGNVIVCAKTNLSLGLAFEAVDCPKLADIKEEKKLNITMGPKGSVNCEKQQFNYKPGRDITITLHDEKTCAIED